MTAVATRRSESQLVEDAIRAYVVEQGRGESARQEMRRLLEDLRRRPEPPTEPPIETPAEFARRLS